MSDTTPPTEAETLAKAIATTCADTALTNYHVLHRDASMPEACTAPSLAELVDDMLPYVQQELAPVFAQLASAKASLAKVEGERDALHTALLNVRQRISSNYAGVGEHVKMIQMTEARQIIETALFASRTVQASPPDPSIDVAGVQGELKERT